MSHAAALLEEARAHGVTVEPAGEYIRIRPAAACPEGLKARLREHKAEVLALLATPADCATLPGVRSWVYPWPVMLPGLGSYRVDAFELCAGCSCGTWSRYGAIALCFACASRRARP